jgi:hypothetical protein
MTDPAPPIEQLNEAAKPDMGALLENYGQNFNMNLIKFFIFTFVQIGVLYFVLAGSGITEVSKNWPKYRCSPLIMPFAGFFGYDATENFNYCMKNIFSSNAGAVLAPLYGIMANFTEIVGTVSNVANSFRLLIANLLHGMERLMSSFRDRFRTILFSVRTSFMKIQSLMGRVYSTFYAVVFMGLSGLKAADNLAHNDLVTFMMEFCFLPDTLIPMANGSIIPMSSLKIGDRLAPVGDEVPIVTSLFAFDGTESPMVRIGETVVSSKHYMLYDPLGIWIEAGQHPYATPEPSSPVLLCLNTSNHKLRIGDYTFSDYDESSDPKVALVAQMRAQKLLNGLSTPLPFETKDYILGIDGRAVIRMSNSSVKKLADIRVGESLFGGGKVLGIVREVSDVVVQIPGLARAHYISPSQLMWDAKSNSWRRAAEKYPNRCVRLKSPVVLCQLITTNNQFESEGRFYRDYREVSDPDMEEPYAAALGSVQLVA